MRIVCPQCGYSRDIPAGKIPPRSSVATCPKCRFRFRFREDSPPAPDPAQLLSPEPAYPPKPSRPTPTPAHEDLRPTPPPYVPRDARGFQPLPDDVWEPQHRPVRELKPAARWLPDPEPGDEQGGFRPGDPAGEVRAHGPWPEPPARSWVKPPRVEAPRMEEERSGSPDAATVAGDAHDATDGGPHNRAPETGRAYDGQTPPPPVFSNGEERDAAQAGPERETPRPPTPARDAALRGESAPAAGATPRDAQAPSLSELGEALRGEHAGDPAAARTAPAREAAPPQKPQEPDFWASTETGQRSAAEATAGDEPVRDIWARLQAMGGDPAAADKPGRGGKSVQEESRAAELAAPWDELEHTGVVPAFLKTVQNVLFKPGDFFETLEPDAGKVRPLIFAMVVCELVAVFWMVWKFFGMGPNFAELTRTEGFQGLGAGGLGSLALLGLAPVLMIGFSFVDAGLTHFLLGLLRGAGRSFEATYRLLCYAGSPWLLAAAPVPLQYLLPVVLIWHMTLQAIGLKKQHQSGYAQVLASVLVKWSFYLMAFFAVYVLAMRR